MMQFDKFLSLFFINVTIRECNFAMGTISGMGFSHGEIRHLVQIQYTKTYLWLNQST